jgi:hypothetical protein
MKRLYPTKAIRKHCVWCMYGSMNEVKLCPTKDCPLYPLRFGKRKLGYSALKAIRKRCLDCVGGSTSGVKKCPFKNCPLYEFRMGHNPALKGKGGIFSHLKHVRS